MSKVIPYRVLITCGKKTVSMPVIDMQESSKKEFTESLYNLAPNE